jgi:DNA-binding Lrp family transcriptional regulator
MRIDKTDHKLIVELQQDGSVSYAELARIMGLTTKTVSKRVERLLRNDVITIIAQPNPFRLGLFASAMLAIRTDPVKYDHVCDELHQNFFVNHIQKVFGRFDILAFAFFPSWESLHTFIYEELYRIDGVKHIEIHIISETFKRYERFFKKEPFASDSSELNQTDWSLIKTLSGNGRIPPGELSTQLGVHISTIYRRMEVLSKGNYYKIRAIPNPFKLSPSANAYIVIEVGSADPARICETLRRFDEVHFVMATNQHTSIIVCVHTSDTDTLYHFTRDNLLSLKGISRTETFIRAAVLKTYYGWMVMEP